MKHDQRGLGGKKGKGDRAGKLRGGKMNRGDLGYNEEGILSIRTRLRSAGGEEIARTKSG